MEVNCRLCTPEDIPSLSRLWKNTDWGALTPEIIYRYSENAPFGKPMVCVGEDAATGELVGQVAFTASAIHVNGRVVTGFRPMATTVDPSLRVRSINPLNHPIVQLCRFGAGEMARRGDSVLFMLPDPRWRRPIQMVPGFQHATFPHWSIPLPLGRPFTLSSGYEAAELTTWDEEHVNRIFERTAAEYKCMVVRNAETFLKKSGPPEYTVLGVYRSGELVGVVASKQKGDRQWLICDFIAADKEATTETLKAVCNFANDRATDQHLVPPLHKAGILATPNLLPILEQLGFKKDDYTFHLFVMLFGNELSKEDVHPSGWYVSAND